jgi:hypothetical protein
MKTFRITVIILLSFTQSLMVYYDEHVVDKLSSFGTEKHELQ